MTLAFPHTAEWLEADGLGGFASGTVGGVRRRKYHALLLAATTPPTGRVALVNGFDAWIDSPAGNFALTAQAYPDGVIHPDGDKRIESFQIEPWPRWTYRLEDGTRVEYEIFAVHGQPAVAARWRLLEGPTDLYLIVRLFFSGRDFHALHRENGNFRFEPAKDGPWLVWRPYDGMPAIRALTNGQYKQQPVWYRNFEYEEEKARGLDYREDLASPGILRWELSKKEAVWILRADIDGFELDTANTPAESQWEQARDKEEQRRRRFSSPLHQSADAYIALRGSGKTIIAGYPWFSDWGRDTFISLRGLCLATGRLEDAGAILLSWADQVSGGMLPNVFPDGARQPEYNAVDASLWYIIAVHDYLEVLAKEEKELAQDARQKLLATVEAIVAGYMKGTRYGIHMDDDGLLAAGTAGVQLTWMDAKVGDWVVTPRIGKPVEVQALWLNALAISEGHGGIGGQAYKDGLAAFRQRFWNAEGGYLYDVVDVDHRPGVVDGRFRPNQIFAVGGLPLAVVEAETARVVVDAVEARLWTPMGPRSLAATEPGYSPKYKGNVRERGGAYHEGTVWPWLAGPFVEAWVRVRGNTAAARSEARARFMERLLDSLKEAGLGHLTEVADAEPPHQPGGCPFQAWSLGEVLRLVNRVLADPPRTVPEASERGRHERSRIAPVG
jgi:predicted glycogen debranching enzyme